MKKIYDLLYEGEYVDYKAMRQGLGFKAVPGQNYYIFAGGTKPFHAGHDQMIMHAINDAKQDPKGRVILYIGLGDRGPIRGELMHQVWENVIEPYYNSISPNIVIEYADGPVGKVLSLLKIANEIAIDGVRPENMFYIYSDPEDTKDYYLLPKFSKKDPTIELKSSPPGYTANLRGLEPPGVSFMGADFPDRFTRGGESGTMDISGTKMREYLSNNDMINFMKGLPTWMDNATKQNYYQTLLAGNTENILEIKRYNRNDEGYGSYLEEIMNELQHIKKEYASRTKAGKKYRLEANKIQGAYTEIRKLKRKHEKQYENQMLSERLIRNATGYDNYKDKDKEFNRDNVRDFFDKFK